MNTNSRPAIFITGASAGIGRATAELFAARGWFVGLYDVADGAAEALRQQLGPDRCVAGRLDASDATAFAEALRTFFDAAGGRLDLLFNCAGILSTGDFDSIPVERHQRIVDVNLRGVLNGCHAALPYLRRTPGARVVNMASASALHGVPGFASYSSTKFAVRGLTEALGIEWARYGIRVMDVSPPFVATPMVTSIAAPPASVNRLGIRLQAADVALAVWRAAHWRLWPRVHWYPGWQTKGFAALNKLSPSWLNRFTTRLISGY
ncbi:MAG: SDR family oxidoreductase [Nevskia sp.]|nr:SDR family oxidoreductase [Nevskia sp.]